MLLGGSRKSWPERAVTVPILVLLAVLAVVAWVVTIWQATSSGALMDAGVPMAFGMGGRLSLVSAVLFLAIWLVMMAAMMFPSVWPVVLAYTAIARERGNVSVPLFVAGYLLVWEAFGVLAYILYVGVGAFFTGMSGMGTTLTYITGALVVIAGLYQFTPVKSACLARCQGAATVLRAQMAQSRVGALSVGLRHGLDCVGCCSGLMVVLLALGVMDLRWMASVALLIGIEKLGPRTRFLPYVLGVGLIVAGIAFVVLSSPASSMQGM